MPPRSPDEPLTEEQRVFVECVEDILASTPGLRWAVAVEPHEVGGRSPDVYAQFLIRTNPAHDLTLAIELTDRAFVICVNGMRFARKRGIGTRFEWWVERRCQDVERLLAGHLRLTHQKLLTVPVSSTLEIGRGRKWRKFASRDNGLAAILAVLVPYAFVMNTKKEVVYEHWFETGQDE